MQTDAPSTDTSMMRVVHSFYRRELRLVGGVVRGVPAGDVARAAEVADHLTMVGDHLHHHHTTEDRLLWPLLLERVPDELAPIVHLMESQHAQVDDLQQQIGELLPTWRTCAGAAERDRLAELCDRLYLHLAEHLDAEEERLLPIAARTVTQQEWDRLGEEGRRATPRSEMALVYGMFAYEGDPTTVGRMLDGAPWPVRRLVPWLGRRAFRRRARRIHGTATP